MIIRRIFSEEALIIFISSLILLISAQAAHAVVYQYFDEEGTLIVTDNPFGKKIRPVKKERDPGADRREPKVTFRPDVSYEFYETSGKTVFDAMDSTDRLGPYDSTERRRYAGQTRWSFGLSYNILFSYRTEDGLVHASVLVQDIDFSADIAVTLPVLPSGMHPDDHDFDIWEKYMQRLTEHEHDHVRLVREPVFRQEVISAISGIREITLSAQPGEDSEALIRRDVEAQVATIAHEGILKIKHKNDDYDVFTEHGNKHELRNAFFQRM